MRLEKRDVGELGGSMVHSYHLISDSGVEVSLTNIGATITSIRTPDRDGAPGEIVLGFDDPMLYADPEYLKHGYFFGATVGRYANRIAGGHFNIGSKGYDLEVNNGPNHLHGGSGSFNTKLWEAQEFESPEKVGVAMRYVSPHMENGYPGTLTVSVTFTLDAAGALTISYQATTDKKTVLNLTNHSYFNLAGRGTVLDTIVTMQAAKYTPKDDTCVPTGEIASVKGSPLDFIMPHKIGDRVHLYEDGYDHNLIIDGIQGELRPAAEAYEPTSGRTLQFLTTEPGFQFYTAYWLDGTYSRGPLKFDSFAAFCFEAQHYPDSPNKPDFPSTLLSPGETYTQTTIYRFGAR